MLRAKQSFMVGDRRIIHSGDLVHPDDPVVRGRESLFDPIEGAPTNRPRAASRPAQRAADPAQKKAAASAKKAAAAAKKAAAAKAPASTPGPTAADPEA